MLVMEAVLLPPPPAPARGLPEPDEAPLADQTEPAQPVDENPPVAAPLEPHVPAEPEPAPVFESRAEPDTAPPKTPEPPPLVMAAPSRASPPKAAPTQASKPRPKRAAADRRQDTDSVGATPDGSAPTAIAPATGPRHDAAYLTNPAPHYPTAARRQNMQGRVVIFAVVSPVGSCARAEVRKSSGHPLLDEAALQAVRSWRFLPATRDGQPVAAGVEIPIVFRLEG
jgi:protein TonB